MKTYGQVAYEAYCKSAGGVSLVSGATLPAWEALTLPIQRAWAAAVDAVIDVAEADEVVSRYEGDE